MNRVPVVLKRSALRAFPSWVAATVPCKRTVLVRHGVRLTERLLAHELAHVLQAETRPWPLAYLLQWAASGFRYREMPFEVEARFAAGNAWYLAWAEDVLREVV